VILFSMTRPPVLPRALDLATWPAALESNTKGATDGQALNAQLMQLDGAPAKHALIQASTERGLRWAWTDADGAFTLADLPPASSIELTAVAYEHMPASFTVELPLTTPLKLHLPAPAPQLETLPDLVSADFKDSIKRAIGSPEGLEVWLVPPPGTAPLSGQIERRTRVAADGSYTFTGLTSGVYQARILPAWAAGGTWPILGAGALPFEPNSSMPVPPPMRTIEGSITGQVVGANSQAIAGAMLIVRNAAQPDQLWPTQATTSMGAFTVNDCPPGSYMLKIVFGDKSASQVVVVEAGQVAQASFNFDQTAVD
jgi:hypothetical protein